MLRTTRRRKERATGERRHTDLLHGSGESLQESEAKSRTPRHIRRQRARRGETERGQIGYFVGKSAVSVLG